MTKGKMGFDNFRTRILPLFRRSSTSTSDAKSRTSRSPASSNRSRSVKLPSTRSKTSLLRKSSRKRRAREEGLQEEEAERSLADDLELPSPQPPTTQATLSSTTETQSVYPSTSPEPSPISPPPAEEKERDKDNPELRLEAPTPDPNLQLLSSANSVSTVPSLPSAPTPAEATIPHDRLVRKQSLAASSNKRFIKTLLQSHDDPNTQLEVADYFGGGGAPTLSANMLHRKIWVKRPEASATLVQINEEDLVDDVRDMILRKYANSLGRSFDSPDVTLRIVPRNNSNHRQSQSQGERTLGPEEPISRTLDFYYPGGQTVDEALVIDVPRRRTPRNSPRVAPFYNVHPQQAHHHEDLRPMETDQGYFPIIPALSAAAPSPHIGSTISLAGSTGSQNHHSISVLNTGQLPPLPSPGGRGPRQHSHRPKFPRNNTSSPTAISGNPPHGMSIGENRIHTSAAAPVPPPLPTPPIPGIATPQRVATPPPRVASPRPTKTKRPSKRLMQNNLPGSLLDGAVPPINVLIVEDNIINLRLLEAFMKRLKVRWNSAMNGRDAVTKWREGGFHLVLMDIQLPIMNGLDATKEIRRLESVNGVGVLVRSQGDEGGTDSKEGSLDGEDAKEEGNKEPAEQDKLKNTALFKSPVIIVALTASSLQSDRHEALAAGCNDFLTKPVNFVWLERKVMEWGCMQALIDFDGWRKWKDFSSQQQQPQPNNKTLTSAPKTSTTLPSFTTTNSGSKTIPTATSPTTPSTSKNTTAAALPQAALEALNEGTGSANTVDTLASTGSQSTATTSSSGNASEDTEAAMSTPLPPHIPTTTVQAPTPDTIQPSTPKPSSVGAAKTPSPRTVAGGSGGSSSGRKTQHPLSASMGISPSPPLADGGRERSGSFEGKTSAEGKSPVAGGPERRKRRSDVGAIGVGVGGLRGVVEETGSEVSIEKMEGSGSERI